MSNLTFAVDSKNIRIREVNQGQFLELEMFCLSDENPNRNDSTFTKESMLTAIPTVYNKPILGYFSKTTKDFEEHNSDVKFDPDTGKIYEDYEGRDGQKAIGLIRESDKVEVIQKDGLNWLHITCGIWSHYNTQQVRHLIRSKRKKVSIECQVVQMHMDGNIEVIDEFVFTGVTILGNIRGGFTPVIEGITGAHLKLLEFVDSHEFNTSMLAMSFAAKSKYINDAMLMAYNKLIKTVGPPLFIEDIYLDGYILLNDTLSGRSFVASYSVNNNDFIVNLNDSTQMLDINGANREPGRKIFIQKDKIGSEKELVVDFSKEAVSDDPWGPISKTDLRNKILASANYRGLVGKAYLVVLDGWEDAPSSNLKYPIAQIKNGKLVLNRDALNVAYNFLQKNNSEPYYRKALKKLNSLKRSIGMGNNVTKQEVAEEKNVMKNKFVGMPTEFKYIHSFAGRALFTKEEKLFVTPCEVAEDEEVEFKEDALMATNLFIKERVNPDGDDDDVEMTEALMSFIKEEDEIKCSMEQKLAAKDADIQAKDEEVRMAKEACDKMSAELTLSANELMAAKTALETAQKELVQSGKAMLIERVKEMVANEEMLLQNDCNDILELATSGKIDTKEACEKEIAMRVYAAMKREPLSFRLPPNKVEHKDERALAKAKRLIDKIK
jgi:hypothetical protein